MNPTQYKFTAGNRSATGLGYAKTRAKFIITLVDSGMFPEIEKVEYKDCQGKWVRCENHRI